MVPDLLLSMTLCVAINVYYFIELVTFVYDVYVNEGIYYDS